MKLVLPQFENHNHDLQFAIPDSYKLCFSPLRMFWFLIAVCTELEKRISNIENKLNIINEGGITYE